MHKTLTKRGRYIIDWTTGGDDSELLHYALPHQQVRTGPAVRADFSARLTSDSACSSLQVFGKESQNSSPRPASSC